jgi:hypothetical protein
MNTYQSIADEVDVNHMMAVAMELATWERLSGSEQEYEAFQWLEKQYQAYGFKTRLIRHDAYISLPQKATLAINGMAVRSQTHSMVPSAYAAGELIYCEDTDEMKCTDCNGKIVMTRGWITFDSVHIAQARGAVGIVAIQDKVIRECIPSASWGSPAPDGWQLLPKIPVVSIVDEDGDGVAAKLKAGETLNARMTTAVDSSWRKIPLLIADLKAPVETDQFCMFTGHVDSWYYGAIDNGTANAAQVEVARLAAGHQQELRRNLKIVHYSGHSHGRYAGSAWYADNYWEELHRSCVVNVNADSLGGKDAMDVQHSTIMPETMDLAVAVVEHQTGEVFEGMRAARNGDQSFWNVGVSSAFASFSRQKKQRLPNGKMGFERGVAALGAWWHTPDDLPHNIDSSNLLRDGRVFAEYVMTFLTAPVVPLFFTQTAKDILENLKNWDSMAGDALDLTYSIEKAKHLEKVCERFYQSEMDDAKRNKTMLRLARILVPLGFTSGNIYTNEDANPIDAMPSLSAIRELVSDQTGECMKMSLKVALRRSINYVNDSLNRAIELLTDVMI